MERYTTDTHTIVLVTVGSSVRATVATKGGVQVYNEYFNDKAVALAEATDFADYYAAKYAA